MIQAYEGFERLDLDGRFSIWRGGLPAALTGGQETFDSLWRLHPDAYHEIRMGERRVKTPRWQQAYHRDYRYSGTQNTALAVPELLQVYWEWACAAIDTRLNGLLLNWYDGCLGHYIGKHRDSTIGMVPGSSIVTISFGEQRKFRFRPWRGKGFTDFLADHGCVFIIPFDTNLAWTHEVPASKHYLGRRVSLTLRVFE